MAAADARLTQSHRVPDAGEKNLQVVGHGAEGVVELEHVARVVDVERSEALQVRACFHCGDHRLDEIGRDRVCGSRSGGGRAMGRLELRDARRECVDLLHDLRRQEVGRAGLSPTPGI